MSDEKSCNCGIGPGVGAKHSVLCPLRVNEFPPVVNPSQGVDLVAYFARLSGQEGETARRFADDESDNNYAQAAVFKARSEAFAHASLKCASAKAEQGPARAALSKAVRIAGEVFGNEEEAPSAPKVDEYKATPKSVDTSLLREAAEKCRDAESGDPQLSALRYLQACFGWGTILALLDRLDAAEAQIDDEPEPLQPTDAELVATIRDAIRLPENGANVCRWCNTRIREAHTVGCFYVQARDGVDRARVALTELARRRGVSDG